MEIQFILEKVHRKGFLSMRAYRIVFTDSQFYCIHLGEDAAALPMGAAVGGLAGAIGQSIAEKHSEKIISKKLEEMDVKGLDSMVAGDKRSFQASYAQLEGIESEAYAWNRWPSLTFKIRDQKPVKFTFDLQMENLEEERQAVLEFLRGKRPDLV